MAIFRGVGSVGDIADNSLLEEITAKATAAEASATSASSSATTATTKAAEAATSATSALNTELTSASFSTANGVLTLTKQDSETVTTDLDGRYLPLSGGTLTGDLKFGDTDKVTFGDSDDLEIYHTISATYIEEKDPNSSLFIKGSALVLQASGTGANNYIEMGGTNDPVILKYDGNTRLATTNAGITVTGTLTATGYNDTNWNTAYNNHITGVNFSGSTLTLTQQDGGTLTTTINGSIGQWTTSGSDIYYNSGNVGIGTSSPDKLLDLESSTNPTVRLSSSKNGTFTDNEVMSSLEFYSADGSGAGAGVRSAIRSLSTNEYGSRTELTFSTTGASTLDVEAMRIDSDGNVGIGETNPNRKLHVSGSGSTIAAKVEATDGNQSSLDLKNSEGEFRLISDGGELSVYDQTDNTERFRIDTDGKVGIGTSDPSYTLDVNSGTTDDTVRFKSSDDTVSIVLEDDNTTNRINSSGTGIRFDIGNSEAVRIASSGNVGIGTFNPSTKLDVSGTVTATSLAIPDLSIGTVSGNTVISESGSGNFLLKGAAVGITDTNDHVHLLASGDVISLYYDNAVKLATASGGVTVTGDVAATTFTGDGSNLTNLPSSGLANVVEDTTPELGGALSCNNNSISGASTIQTGDGSASAPAYTFSDDTNTGMYSPAADTIAFSEGGTERMRIDSSGRLLVGTTTTGIYGSKLKVNGRVESSSGFVATSNSSVFTQGGYNGGATISTKSFTSYSSSAQKQLSFQTSQGIERGNITIAGTSAYFNSVSDERLKENIQDSGDAGSKIDAIQIRQFDWRDSGEHQDFGVIAQELQPVAPEAVSEGYTEDDMMSVDYSKLVPTLIKEIQSLRTRVAQLENN